MKAVIMCGGAGSRLKPLTEVRPKPLVEILNMPVLERILRHLSQTQGVSEVFLSLGFKAQDIASFCAARSFPLPVRLCEETTPLGTAGGVKNCLPESDEPVCVLSGDNLIGVDLDKVLAFHTAAGADVTLVGKDVPDPREYGTVVTDDQQNILSFIEKPTWEQARSGRINTGVYILSPAILELIPANTFYDFSEHLFPLLLERKKRFLCYPSDAFWADIGEFPLYLSASAALLQTPDTPVPPGDVLYTEDHTDAAGNTFFAPCLVGGGARFGANNRIGPFAVIGAGVRIGSGCLLKDCVVGENAVIGDGTDVLGAILDENVTVGANCVLESGAVAAYGVQIGNFARVLAGVKIWPGKKILPESVLSADMFYDSPQQLEADVFGVSGKLYSQFTVSDAARLGQAIASVRGTMRIGVGNDGKSSSEVYKALCAAGIRSCGVICYDFEEIFKAQAVFYAAYCALDLFLYISTSGDTLNVSFFGRNGFPVSAKTAREINSNFRFSAFSFASAEESTEIFRMHLLSTAYTAALHRLLGQGLGGLAVSAECENPCLKSLFCDFLKKAGAAERPGGVQFLLNETGTDMYCIENDRFYSADRIRAALCELEFAEGKTVIVPEDVPVLLEETAKKYGARVVRLYENAGEAPAEPMELLECLWCFDAVFLCVKLLQVLVTAKISVEELLYAQRDFSVRRKVIELDCPPAKLRERLEAAGARKDRGTDVYYRISGSKGTAQLRQLGNANRLRMLVEAADMETAKELTAQISAKISGCDIDNKTKK